MLKLLGRDSHPILAKTAAAMRVRDLLKGDHFQSASPAPFVGRYGYPEVNVGILAPPVRMENTWEYDAPRHWAKNDFQIPAIVDFRSSLINSRFKADVRSKERMLTISQEVGLASRPVDIEVTLKDRPDFQAAFDNIALPLGPTAQLKKVELTSNPHIPQQVQHLADDDLRASQGLSSLFDRGFDENYLSRILSVGALGLERNKKLVPTRWAITATDDTLGKHLHQEVLDFPEADLQAFFGGYLGNFYCIILLPGLWSYELFEMYTPRSRWNRSPKLSYMTDYEGVTGRKDYAQNTVGGYYAARLAILEKLKQMKRQARVLTLRFITDDYSMPLGVWVVREATRKALQSQPLAFSEKRLAFTYAKSVALRKFGQGIDDIFESSVLINKPEQKGLMAFSK
ncbi:MAG: hypothetical protein V1735_07350 [Nanoarchaeota archaeon]